MFYLYELQETNMRETLICWSVLEYKATLYIDSKWTKNRNKPLLSINQ